MSCQPQGSVRLEERWNGTHLDVLERATDRADQLEVVVVHCARCLAALSAKGVGREG